MFRDEPTGPTTDQICSGCLVVFLFGLIAIAAFWLEYKYRKQIVKDAIRETIGQDK